MDIQNWFSRQKKKVKHLGSKHKPGRTGVGVDGESANPTNPPPRPEPYVIVDDGDGSGADFDGRQAGSTDQPPHPDESEPVPANRGENDKGEGVVEIDGRNVSPAYSHPHPGVEVGAGSGPGRERDGADGEDNTQIYFRLAAPSIPHSGEPDGALTWLFKLLPSSLPQAT